MIISPTARLRRCVRGTPSNRTSRWAWLAVLALAAACFGPAARSATAAPASYLYWTDVNGYADADPSTFGYIGRAGIDGSDVRPTFARPWTTDEYRGIAAYGSYIYVTHERRYTTADGSANEEAAIGRLNLDGTGFEDRYVVPAPETDQPYLSEVVANDKGLFWSGGFYDYGAPLGHAGLDGTAIDPDFAHIGQFNAYNSDQSANSTALFFAHRYFTEDGLQGDLARVALDGSDVDLELIRDLRVGSTAATDQYVYWVDAVTSAIGRARTDGSQVDRAFIPNAAPDTGGLSGTALVTDGKYLYWNVGERIDRSTIDGSDITRGFIQTGRRGLVALAIGDAAAPSNNPPNPPGPPSTPTGPQDAPPPTPTPTTPSQLPTPTLGRPVVTPPAPAPKSSAAPRPRATLSASGVVRRKFVTIRVTNVPAKAKVTVTWRPKRGKATRQAVTVNRSLARTKAPAIAGPYRVSVTYKGKTLLRSRAVVVR